MTHIYFAGAELPAHLEVLRECGVERVAVNLNTLLKTRKKDLANFASKERLGGLEWVLYSDTTSTPLDPLLEILEGAEVVPEAVTGPISWWDDSIALQNSEHVFVPIWDGGDVAILREHVKNFGGVVLPDSVVDNDLAVTRASASINPKHGVFGAISGGSRHLDRFNIVISSAWWSVQKNGETQVWTGSKLTRLNNKDKNAKRQKLVGDVEKLGCDVSSFLLDDPTETVRVAIKSWLKLERWLLGGASEMAETTSEVAIPYEPEMAGEVLALPRVDNPRLPGRYEESALLPLMQVEEFENKSGETVQRLRTSPRVTRMCATCSLAQMCPKFSMGSQCAFEIPVNITDKEDIQDTLRLVYEAQFQNVMMRTFAQDTSGEVDGSLVKDRLALFDMASKWKALNENSATLTMNLKASGSGAQIAEGVGSISRLFGPSVGETVQELSAARTVIEVGGGGEGE